MTLKEKFEVCREYGITQETLARQINKGESTVSGLLNGKYNSGKKELYEARLNAFLDEQIAAHQPKQSGDNGVWLSLSQQKIKERVRRMKESKFSFLELITGESGMGKTFLLEMVVKELGGLYVKARKSLSASAFMSQLLRAVGEKPRGNTDDKFELFCETIAKSGVRLIVIDEADLFVRDNDLTFERKFELLREVYEFGRRENLGITVIAAGLGKLEERINGLGGYLQSRFTYSPEMTLSHDELLNIGKLNGLSEDVSEYLAECDNARLYEKTALNLTLGYNEKVSANLVYISAKGKR
ncbi:AAA family ATPase [Campylobacter curvus]|uniref:AAA family ATPase n=1 Tax=Campylobacter curvus TaxID=200 RepID=UPI00147047B2|nr:AAA family ATPase [Campylobacter curvus]